MTSPKSRPAHPARLAGVALMLGCAFASPVLAQGKAVTGPIEYGYWGNAKRTELTDGVSRLFEAEHPGTKVQSVVAEYQAYIERLTVQAAAGELPCVTQMQNIFLATYATRGVLRPLDDLVKSGAIDVSGIPPAILEAGKVNGKLFMIPTGTFVRMPAYNAGMVKQHGIPEPAKRMTHAEYRNWLVAAQKKLPKGVYAAENDGAWLFTFDSWIVTHGETLFKGKAIGFRPETVIKYLTFWKELKDAGVLVPVDRIDEQFLSLELRPLARGRALTSSRDIPQLLQVSQTLASANLPSEVKFMSNPTATTPGKSANVPGANGLAISTSCKNPATAAAYVNFFSNSPKAALAFQSANGVVVSTNGRKVLLASTKTPPPVRAAIEELDALVAAGDLSVPPAYAPGYQALQDPLRRAYEGVMRGQEPAAAAKQFVSEAARTIR